jgi:uncharacterized membrane protein
VTLTIPSQATLKDLARKYYLVAGLFILALALRLYHLDWNSVWLDEAFTYFYVQQGWIEIALNVPTDCHPPLFYWLTKAALCLGQGDSWLRLVAAVSGALTVPVFYYIGKEFTEDAGLIMALFLAISPFHVAYSQEARMYTLLLLTFSLSFLFYLKKKYLIAAVFGGVSLWVHFYSAASYLLLWATQGKDRLKSILVYGLIASPLLFFIIPIFSAKTSGAPAWGWPGYHLITEGLRQMLGYGCVLPLAFGILIILGWISLAGENRSLFLTLTIFLAGGMIVSMLISFVMPMAPRYLITLMPALFLLAVLGLRVMPTSNLIVMVMVILTIFPLYTYYTGYVKDDWRPIPSVIGLAPVAVVGPEFYPAFESTEEYHSLPLRYYCPTCMITDPWNASYLVAVNNAIVPGMEIYNRSGLRVYSK